MNFLILGSLEVRSHDQVIPITAPKLRTVIAVLLLDANKFVAIDQLSDYIWDGRPPAGWQGTLQTYMYRLRRQLSSVPEASLRTRGAGYTIEVSSANIDAELFRQKVAGARELAEGGDLYQAITEFRHALSIWRGRALADVPGERLQQEAQFIEAERIAAYEELLGLEIAVGRHQRVIPELVKLVAAHPFCEMLTAQLIIAFYRSGRQAEALQKYVLTRRRLREELGIEPSVELQHLQRAILRQTPPEEIQLPTRMDGFLAGSLADRTDGGIRIQPGGRVSRPQDSLP